MSDIADASPGVCRPRLAFLPKKETAMVVIAPNRRAHTSLTGETAGRPLSTRTTSSAAN